MAERLAVKDTVIPGLFLVDLVLNGDERGWFKESYHKKKMEALGLPEFNPLQNNFSFNRERGVTRGLHAEPWEKFISVANGRVFGAWVDLRKGKNFGTKLMAEISPETAVFVPRGVANSYQTLDENITYTYLVNEYWSPGTTYLSVNLFDEELGIPWPMPEASAIVSEKDKANPHLNAIAPMDS